MNIEPIGLLIGSFNPIHKGHLDIAQAGLFQAKCQEVWFILQVQNAFKAQPQLAAVKDRQAMIRLAIQRIPQFKLRLTESSVIMTAKKITKQHQNKPLVLLMGQDLARSLPKWPDYKQIVDNYKIYSYARKRSKLTAISSEIVRMRVKKKQSIAELVPLKAERYIRDHELYT